MRKMSEEENGKVKVKTLYEVAIKTFSDLDNIVLICYMLACITILYEREVQAVAEKIANSNGLNQNYIR